MARRYVSLSLLVSVLVSLAIPVNGTFAAAEAQPISQVRLFHAAPGLGALEVVIDGIRLPLPAPAFGQATPYLNLPAGRHEFALIPVGAVPPIAATTRELELAPGQPYTLLVLGVPPTLTVLEDTRFATIGGPARVRFVHGSPNAPATVDVVVAGGAPLFRGVGYGEATPYIDVPAGTMTLEVRVAGTETVLLGIPDVTLVVGTVYTLGDVGLVDGVPPLGALSLIDS